MDNNYEKFTRFMAEMIKKYGNDVLDEVVEKKTQEKES